VLVDWVENGVEPDTILAAGGGNLENKETRSATD